MALVDWTMKKDDRLPEIQATLLDANDTIIDLSGFLGVRFIMTNKATGVNKVDAPAVVVDAPGGVVKYQWEAVDTDTAGAYNAEFEVQFADGRLETFPNDTYLHIKIVSDLGGIN